MKPYPLTFRLLITLYGIVFLTIAPSLSNDAQQSRARQVRVTTGMGAVQGWEQGLVKTNPNLARWHWDPIYYYKQGYGPVTSKNSYINGNVTHKQTINHNAQNNTPSQIQSWHDIKPEHVPYSPQAMAELQGRMAHQNIAGNPMLKKESVLGELMHQPNNSETVATYGTLLPKKDSLNTTLTYQSQKTAVYGQLLNNKNIHKHNQKRTASRGGNVAQKNQ